MAVQEAERVFKIVGFMVRGGRAGIGSEDPVAVWAKH